MAKTWRRLKSSDTWHFCKNCTEYPNNSDDVTSTTKPSYGELCNQCKGKEAANNCT